MRELLEALRARAAEADALDQLVRALLARRRVERRTGGPRDRAARRRSGSRRSTATRAETRPCARAARLGIAWPRIFAVPPVGRIRPISVRIVVVLPAPFGPTKPKMWPRSTANETPRSASTFLRRNGVRYVFRRSRTSMTRVGHCRAQARGDITHRVDERHDAADRDRRWPPTDVRACSASRASPRLSVVVVLGVARRLASCARRRHVAARVEADLERRDRASVVPLRMHLGLDRRRTAGSGCRPEIRRPVNTVGGTTTFFVRRLGFVSTTGGPQSARARARRPMPGARRPSRVPEPEPSPLPLPSPGSATAGVGVGLRRRSLGGTTMSCVIGRLLVLERRRPSCGGRTALRGAVGGRRHVADDRPAPPGLELVEVPGAAGTASATMRPT